MNGEEKMELTGTIINYYFHCKRQCWLFSNRLNLEDNSEKVKMGKVIHEERQKGQPDTELSIGNVKVDKITKDYLVEVKMSDADVDAVEWQVYLYLKILKEKGLERKGKIEFIEKNRQDRKILYVELTEDTEKKLEQLSLEINELIMQPSPPHPIHAAICKKCAYYEYCYC